MSNPKNPKESVPASSLLAQMGAIPKSREEDDSEKKAVSPKTPRRKPRRPVQKLSALEGGRSKAKEEKSNVGPTPAPESDAEEVPKVKCGFYLHPDLYEQLRIYASVLPQFQGPSDLVEQSLAAYLETLKPLLDRFQKEFNDGKPFDAPGRFRPGRRG